LTAFPASLLVGHDHGLARRQLLNEHHMLVAWLSFFPVGLAISTSGSCLGIYSESETAVNEKYETHEHDVLIIGAGGAGLCAAIAALGQGASSASVQVVARQGDTVMAEADRGGMANVDRPMTGACISADTMRGASF